MERRILLPLLDLLTSILEIERDELVSALVAEARFFPPKPQLLPEDEGLAAVPAFLAVSFRSFA